MQDPWTSFTRSVPIKADKATVFRCWSTSEGMESWFLRSCQYFDPGQKPRLPLENCEKGDKYKFLWHGYSDEIAENGEILEQNGTDHFAFTFEGCQVTIRLGAYQDYTILELTQSNIPKEEDPEKNLHVQCGFGWTFYLTNLKSILEGGIDLRNRDVNLKNMITA